MHAHGMEVAPLAPLLIPLGELLVWAIALAVCLAVVYFAKAFFGLAGGLLGKLPVVGGWIDSGLTSIEHKIVATMSSAAASCDAKVGAAFHQLARVIDWLGEEIERHANLIWTLASLALGSNVASELHWITHSLWNRIRSVEAAAVNALHRIETAEQRLGRGIGADVQPRVKAIEQEISHVVERDIAGLRARERALEDGALSTFRWIKAHPGALASTAFAGAVAWAVGRLGMGWARCTNWNRIGRQVCGTPLGDIEAILGLLATGAVIADFRELVKLAQSVEHGVATTLQDVAKL